MVNSPPVRFNKLFLASWVNDHFTDTLKELPKRDDWDELIIEATGIADPRGKKPSFK